MNKSEIFDKYRLFIYNITRLALSEEIGWIMSTYVDSFHEVDEATEEVLRSLLQRAWEKGGSTVASDCEIEVSPCRSDSATIYPGDEIAFIRMKYTQTGIAHADSRCWHCTIIAPPMEEQREKGEKPRYFTISTVEVNGRLLVKVDVRGEKRVHSFMRI
ncbi:MAG: hypothetical protein WAQ22_00175 [Candidatus Saccharimonas sp.]